MLLCSLDAEKSSGEIFLKSADPTGRRGQPRYLSEPADIPRIVANLRLATRLLAPRGSSGSG